jgi:hypothetical protein
MVQCSRVFGERLKYKEGVERKAIFPPQDSSSSGSKMREGREGDGDQRSWRLYVENTNTENGEERMSEDQREGRRGYLIEISILLAESEVWQDKIKINEFECDCGGRTSGLSERKDALMPQQKNGSGVWW